MIKIAALLDPVATACEAFLYKPGLVGKTFSRHTIPTPQKDKRPETISEAGLETFVTNRPSPGSKRVLAGLPTTHRKEEH